MNIFLCIYLIIGAIVATAVFRVYMVGVSSKKLNLNKYDILAVKTVLVVGMTVAYPIAILLIMLGGIMNELYSSFK